MSKFIESVASGVSFEGVRRTSDLLPRGIAEGVLIMKTSLLSLFAGTVFLAGSAIASAGEPMALTSAELDAVTAGIDQSNYANNYVSVYQSAEAVAATFFGDATATAANSSSVRITNNQSNTVD